MQSCMAYFPFIIRREDLPHIREAIRKRHNKATFEEAYATFGSEDPGAQYNVMCTWLYLNRYDNYTWRIKDQTPYWDGFHRPKPRWGHWGDRSIFRPGDINFTVPYLSDHCTYGLAPSSSNDGTLVQFRGRDYRHTRRVLEHLLLSSLCHLETQPPFSFRMAKKNASQLSQWALSQHTSFCPTYLQTHPFNDAWFRFEEFDFSKTLSIHDKMLLKTARVNRLKNCKHTYIFI